MLPAGGASDNGAILQTTQVGGIIELFPRRHVLYTCYQPAALATEADTAAKRHAYENYAITTHWPAANVTVGAPPSGEERRKYTLPRTRSRVGTPTIAMFGGVEVGHQCHARIALPSLFDCCPARVQKSTPTTPADVTTCMFSAGRGRHHPASGGPAGIQSKALDLEACNSDYGPRLIFQIEDDTILRLAGQQPYDPATERRCRALVAGSIPELTALLAGHELRKAEALAGQVT